MYNIQRGGGGEAVALPFPTVLEKQEAKVKWYAHMHVNKGLGR